MSKLAAEIRRHLPIILVLVGLGLPILSAASAASPSIPGDEPGMSAPEQQAPQSAALSLR